jgi:hypothetical protein
MRKRDSCHKAEEKNTQELNQRIHEFAPVLLGALLGERFARDDSVRKKLTHVRPNFVVCACRMGLGNVASDMNSWQMWARDS